MLRAARLTPPPRLPSPGIGAPNPLLVRAKLEIFNHLDESRPQVITTAASSWHGPVSTRVRTLVLLPGMPQAERVSGVCPLPPQPRSTSSSLPDPVGTPTCWACSPVTASRRVVPLVSWRSPTMTRSPTAPVRSRCLRAEEVSGDGGTGKSSLNSEPGAGGSKDQGRVRVQGPGSGQAGRQAGRQTHVPQHSSTEVRSAAWEAGSSARATGTPTDTTRTGSGYT